MVFFIFFRLERIAAADADADAAAAAAAAATTTGAASRSSHARTFANGSQVYFLILSV
jgi:hypothetical protein